MNTLSRPRYFICKMSLLSVISLTLLVTSISPVMANTASFTPKETAVIEKGKAIATECLNPKTSTKSIGKTSSRNTLNTLLTCSAFAKTINTAQQNKVAAFPLVIPVALTAKEAALLAVSAAATACKINKDCTKNAAQILNNVITLGSTLFGFTGQKLADFKQSVTDLWNDSKDSGIIRPQPLQSKKVSPQEKARREAAKLAKEKALREARETKAKQQAQKERQNLINTARDLLGKLKDTKEKLSENKSTNKRFEEANVEIEKAIHKLSKFLESPKIPQTISSEKIRAGTSEFIRSLIIPASKALQQAQKLLNNQ